MLLPFLLLLLPLSLLLFLVLDFVFLCHFVIAFCPSRPYYLCHCFLSLSSILLCLCFVSVIFASVVVIPSSLLPPSSCHLLFLLHYCPCHCVAVIALYRCCLCPCRPIAWIIKYFCETKKRKRKTVSPLRRHFTFFVFGFSVSQNYYFPTL